MTGSKIVIEDPDYVMNKKIDANGRLYIGQEWQNTRVRIAFEVLDDEEE
ncbi:hypothetical protein ACFQL7_21040 [Halocatena marina]|uniref:Uncharacterized protein n=1 Tax=Halocatena marina TaxID=2934937 RepID=A0ABD5YXL2_9EURY